MGGARRRRELPAAKPPPIQRKKLVSPTGDAAEAEADDVAHRVTGGLGATTVQSAKAGDVQGRRTGDDVAEAAPEVEQQIERERGRGAPLPGADRPVPVQRGGGPAGHPAYRDRPASDA